MTFTARLHTQSLDSHPQAGSIKKILSAALEAAAPVSAVQDSLTKDKNTLKVGQKAYTLKEIGKIYLVAIGKAAPPMASAARQILGKYLEGGIVVGKYPSEHELGGLTLHLAGHPLPDERSEKAGKAILSLLAQSAPNDLILFLISGGGSALITVPKEGVSLADMQKLTSLLLGSGARIDEINTLRRALDRVKGGGLARAAYPAQIATLILSDVVNSPLEAIASGPTVPNPDTNADALAVLKKYDLLRDAPPAIIAALQKNEKLEEKMAKGETLIVGSNQISASAARDEAILAGFESRILTTSMQGEASQQGCELASRLRATDEHPLCLIIGGETTVTLGNAAGHGGRNQELALAAAQILSGAENKMLITLATDGEDGPTDGAGAVVTGESLAKAERLGLDAARHLREHNAYPFFNALGDLLKTGPTGTNVNDLVFLFSFYKRSDISHQP